MTNFQHIILFGDFTFYQFLGLMTIVFAGLNVLLYLFTAGLMWKTTHRVTRALRNKLLLEAFITMTTVLMGIGAFMDVPDSFWQLAYFCRVGFLILSPFILWRLVLACLEIINTKEKLDHGKIDNDGR